MRIKTFVVMAAMLLLLTTACSKENGYIQTKDVSFLFPVKCTELYVSDTYAGKVEKTIHLTDVDTAVMKFHMRYGTHNIVMTADENTVSKEFTVSNSTQSLYEFTPLTISIVVDDKWDGEITYEAQ